MHPLTAIGLIRSVTSTRLLHRPSLPLTAARRSAPHPGRFAWGLTDRRHAETDAGVIAEVYAWLGNRDAAFGWLERAYAQQDADLPWVRMRPALQRLRGDPRWHAFLRKMNLPLD